MRKALAEQSPLAAGHLFDDGVAGGLGRREPRQFESVLLGFAVPIDRNDVGQRYGMLTGIVKRRYPGVGKYSAIVNGAGEGGTRGNASGPRSFSMWRSKAARTRSW